jgi:hypothetical protein
LAEYFGTFSNGTLAKCFVVVKAVNYNDAIEKMDAEYGPTGYHLMLFDRNEALARKLEEVRFGTRNL